VSPLRALSSDGRSSGVASQRLVGGGRPSHKENHLLTQPWPAVFGPNSSAVTP